MGFRDLRSFLAKLEEDGQLLQYNDQVVPEPDIRAIAKAAGDMGDTGPAVMINNILGHKKARIAVNVHGSWANHAVMLGMPKTTSLKEQFVELDKRWIPILVKLSSLTMPHARKRLLKVKILIFLSCYRCIRSMRTTVVSIFQRPPS